MRLHSVRYGNHADHLLILHGLFGSERNWTQVARILMEHFTVIIPDMRNHGQSSHHPEHTIEAMRRDIEELSDNLNLSRFFLLGHSMGGYVAMDYALNHPGRISGLIVEDIAPRSYPNQNLLAIIEAMQSVDLSLFADKKEVDRLLTSSIPNPAVRQFLMTNLFRSGGQLTWRINLPALKEFVKDELRSVDFEYQKQFFGKTLFIGGGKSPYRIWENEQTIRKYFPHAQIEIIERADHWVHYDALDVFCETIIRFIHSSNKEDR